MHHQYAGARWEKYPNLYEKHMDGYTAVVPSAFLGKNIFELYAYMVMGDYELLADAFYQPLNPGLSRDELALVLKRRLRSCGLGLAAKVGPSRHMKPE